MNELQERPLDQSRHASRIIGTGSYLPQRVVENAELAARLSLTEEGIFRVTGIKSRHWADPQEDCSQLAEQAARQALDSGNVSVSELDAIIVSTTSPDTPFPSTACHVQRRLDAPHIGAFDISASCSGFLYGLSMADSFIQSGLYSRILVVAAEIKSRYLDLNDQSSAILFGDGAGAVVVARSEASQEPRPEIVSIRLHADGAYQHLITIPAGGSRSPMTQHTIEARQHTIRLQGGPLFRIAVKRLSAALLELLGDFHLSVSDIRQVVTHQANDRILRAIAKRAGFPAGKLYSVIQQYGNTSSASLPIALDHAHRQGAFHAGDWVVLGSFGGGLTWGTALLRW